jgi:hypothetical protein
MGWLRAHPETAPSTRLPTLEQKRPHQSLTQPFLLTAFLIKTLSQFQYQVAHKGQQVQEVKDHREILLPVTLIVFIATIDIELFIEYFTRAARREASDFARTCQRAC